jgi:hypothetical protein
MKCLYQEILQCISFWLMQGMIDSQMFLGFVQERAQAAD